MAQAIGLVGLSSAAGMAPAGTGVASGGGGFGQAMQKAGSGGGGTVTPQQISLDGLGTTNLQPGLGNTSIALQPKIESVGRTLETVKTRVMRHDGGPLLEKRLVAMETRFQQVGKRVTGAGSDTSPMAMLQLQNEVYEMSEELELLSKVVEQVTSGVKTVLQMQV